ncbi:MAG: nucleic acid-binding protein [Methanoregula sp.]|nr:nucleic acid-binding protein [Methanoregula sp.]
MLFHYALVDDLITKEEFEQRVETKMDECGDLTDEPDAALLVVEALGRKHVKIRELSGKSSLFSFFGKVVDKTDPREFDRNDGEKGWVATLLLGDETGTVRIVLWDEKAGATLEIEKWDVLEVIGRHPGRGGKEIYALALRKAGCEIAYDPKVNGSGFLSLSTEPVTLDVLLLETEPPRTFTRKDGSTAGMVEAVIGDAQGTARLVAWAPELITGLPVGASIHITSAKPNDRNECRAYSIDEKSTVTTTDVQITVPFTHLASVSDTGIYSVQGEVRTVLEPRSFTSRDGSLSWVRNLCLGDATEELRVVLWGEKALIPIHAGDRITVYHARAKPNRSGEIELGAGRGSCIRVPEEKTHEIVFCGTIIAGNGCTFVDNGTDRYLVEGNFPHGSHIRISGMLSGNRIQVLQSERVERTADEITSHITRLQEQFAT